MEIREEQAADEPAIHALVAGAFVRPQEADLVRSLRGAGDLTISMLAVQEGRIVGYAGLSRLRSPACALALAPVAVAEDVRCRGIGASVIRAALDRARQRRYGIVFVLGEPAYYARFGFSAAAALPFPCRYAGPYFMALHLSDDPAERTPVIYAPAFDALA
jgi:putative acetyltransferase